MTQSYGSDEDFKNWLSANGLSLPDNAPDISVLRLIGSSYVDAAYESKLGCSQRAGGFEQTLAWPRKNHTLGGQTVPSDMVPPAWVNASYRAAFLQASSDGWATNGRDPNRVTKREKADTIEREFFAHGEAGGTGNAASGFNVDPMIDALVSVWLCKDVRSFENLMRVI